jgi:hypothetical protein
LTPAQAEQFCHQTDRFATNDVLPVLAVARHGQVRYMGTNPVTYHGEPPVAT